jgi:uncharacterized protein with PQ loop repeat
MNELLEEADESLLARIEPDDPILVLQKENKRIKLIMMILTIILSLLIAYLLFINNTNLELIAGALGVLATITGTLQFIPQIHYTLKTRDFGVLNVNTLMMQCPGSFLFAYSLFIQQGTNWTTWASFVVCGALQFFLVFLYFWFRFSEPVQIVLGVNEELLSSHPILDQE